MQSCAARRASAEVSSHVLHGDNDDDTTHLSSQQMPNSLPEDTCGRGADAVWHAGGSCVKGKRKGRVYQSGAYPALPKHSHR